MSSPDGAPPRREEQPSFFQQEPPRKFPDDFHVNEHFIRDDSLEPHVFVNSPFDYLGSNILKRAAVYVADCFKHRRRLSDLPNVRFPAQEVRKDFVTRLRFDQFKSYTEAQISFLKKQINLRDAQIRQMKLATTGLSKEQEALRDFIHEVAAELRQKLSTAETSVTMSAWQIARFEKMLDELTKRIAALQPVKSKFSIRNLEGIVTLRSRAVTAFQDMALLTGLVTMFLQSMGYLQPEKTVGPPLYETADKKSIEFMNGFRFGVDLNVQSMFSNGLGIATGLSRVNGIDTSSLIMRYCRDNICAKISSNLNDSVSAKLSFNEIWCPDMKLKMEMGFPYNMKAQLKSLHKYGSFAASLGMVNNNTQAYLSASIGTKAISAGAFCEMIPPQLLFPRYGAGITLSDDDSTAKLSWSKMDDVNLSVVKASFLYQVTADTTVGTLMERNLSTGVNQFSLGMEHAVDDELKIKTTLRHDWTVSTMLKQRLFGKSVLSMCSEFNVRDHDAVPRFGLSFNYGS